MTHQGLRGEKESDKQKKIILEHLLFNIWSISHESLFQHGFPQGYLGFLQEEHGILPTVEHLKK